VQRDAEKILIPAAFINKNGNTVSDIGLFHHGYSGLKEAREAFFSSVTVEAQIF